MCLLEAALAVYVFVLSNNKQTNKQKKPQKLIYWVSGSGPTTLHLKSLFLQKELFLRTFPEKC